MATLTIRPSGVGNETAIGTQFPDEGEHWEKVDDIVADEDATYVATLIDARDLYALEDPGPSGTIYSVTVYVRVTYVSDVGTINAKSSIRIGGTTYDGDAHAHPVGFTTESHIWNQNPNSETAWTWADINNLEAGVWLQGIGTRWTRCTQVYVVVNHDIISVDLLCRAEVGQSHEDLLSNVVIRQSTTIELLGKAIIRRPGVPIELLGNAKITRPAYSELFSRFLIPAIYSITGITKDKAGNRLGNCEVALFRTIAANPPTYLFIKSDTSDVNGDYSFTNLIRTKYFVRAQDGSPNVFDTTDNEIVPI